MHQTQCMRQYLGMRVSGINFFYSQIKKMLTIPTFIVMMKVKATDENSINNKKNYIKAKLPLAQSRKMHLKVFYLSL